LSSYQRGVCFFDPKLRGSSEGLLDKAHKIQKRNPRKCAFDVVSSRMFELNIYLDIFRLVENPPILAGSGPWMGFPSLFVIRAYSSWTAQKKKKADQFMF
jgi:hypothetical protein